jgi:uncharacterized membrane protein YciS (DUF1049 family)
MRSAQRSLCAAMLSFQAVMLFLSGVVLIGIADLSIGAALGIGFGLAAACIVVAGLLRRRWAYALGWLIQVVSIGLGFVVPMMFILGVVFAALWAGGYFVGAKIDRERAEREVLEQEWAAQQEAEQAARRTAEPSTEQGETDAG